MHRGAPSWYKITKNPHRQKAEMKFSELHENPSGFQHTGSLQLCWWIQPFCETGPSACSRKGHGSVLYFCITPSSVSNSQRHLIKQILSYEMETQTRSLVSFLNRFLWVLFLFCGSVSFWACYIFLPLLFLVSRTNFQTAPQLFSNNFFSLHKRQVNAFWIIPEIPYSAAQWEKSNPASIS